MVIPAIVLGLILFSADMSAPVPFTTIAEGQESGIEEPRQVVVHSAEEWKALWKLHAPDKPLPAVDFTKSTVIGVFLGFRNTGGYRAVISSIEQGEKPEGADLAVTWREARPAPGALLTQVLTFPYHLVRIDRPGAKVSFRKADAATKNDH